MAAASEHLDGFDILVNNAALDSAVSPIADTDEQLWDLAMTLNAKSAFLTTRPAARTMNPEGRWLTGQSSTHPVGSEPPSHVRIEDPDRRRERSA